MSMINNLTAPYYYCQNTFEHCGTYFYIGWEYPMGSVDRFSNIDKSNFRLVK